MVYSTGDGPGTITMVLWTLVVYQTVTVVVGKLGGSEMIWMEVDGTVLGKTSGTVTTTG